MRNIKPHFLSSGPGNLKAPAIASTLVVLPFIVLETVNRRDLGGGFPIPLFATMWLLALSFIVVLMPVLRSLVPERRNTMSRAGVLLRIGALILIAWLWIGLVRDQMPCFLGVPNCD